MTHLYKVSIPNSTLDIFFTSLDTNENSVTFMVVSKEGKVLIDPDTDNKQRTVQFEVRDGSMFAIDGAFVIPVLHLQKMNEYFNL